MVSNKIIGCLVFTVLIAASAFAAEEYECYKRFERQACGSPCQVTCANYGKPCNIIPIRCENHCYCIAGYARNAFGQCIPISKCPRTCGSNEVWKCGSACQRTCFNLGKRCPVINKTCSFKCHCKPGYARNTRGKCISIKYCPSFG